MHTHALLCTLDRCSLYQMPEWKVEANARGGARLSHDDRAALAAYAARATWPAGFVVYQRAMPADGIFVVLRGRIVLRSRVRTGRGFVPGVATPGETFGAEGLGGTAVYATDARADEETETLHLSTARFRAVMREQPQLALCLLAQVVNERTALLERLRELTTLSVEQRLIATLVRLAQAHTFTDEGEQLILDPPRYRLLCELVGATRESVSLVLSRLVGDGLVTREGGTYVVASAARLADRLDQTWLDGDALGGDTATSRSAAH